MPTGKPGPTWTPSHLVPEGGMPSWHQPDFSGAAAPPLDQGLPVSLMERSGLWARIECENGWTTWVDGRLLQPLLRERAAPVAAPAGQAASAEPPAEIGWSFARLPGVGVFALSGMVLVLIATGLPWLGLSLTTLSAWQFSLLLMISGGYGWPGVMVATPLLSSLLVLLPALSGRPQVGILRLVGTLAIALGTLGALFPVLHQPQRHLTVGPLVAVAGGLLISLDRPLTRLIGPRR